MRNLAQQNDDRRTSAAAPWICPVPQWLQGLTRPVQIPEDFFENVRQCKTFVEKQVVTGSDHESGC